MQTAEQLIRALRSPDQRGVGRAETTESGPSNINRLADLDAEAETIRVWDSMVIPGNLQTPAYSEAVIRAAHPRLGGIEVRSRVLRKEARARAFLRCILDEYLNFAWFVIGERAITHCLNLDDGGEAHSQQLQHINRLAAHEKIVIQVLPDGVVTPGLADQFTLYGLDVEYRVGYVETIMGAWYSTRLEDVAKLHSTFSDIAGAAMAPTATREFIREVLSTWRSVKKESPESTEESRSSSPRTPRPATSALESPERPRAPWRTEP
ncbi:DUF5753 domain-containing protein [Streptomyces sp. NPDC002928]|uniref:DUF5753 domain-containing protein n=1 Tax=Streptomyces sp. NPDC002928 TaxID=3154440 RepID=UPI0033AB1BCB